MCCKGCNNYSFKQYLPVISLTSILFQIFLGSGARHRLASHAIAAARVHTIKYQSKIFPKDSKTALGTEIGPLGTEL